MPTFRFTVTIEGADAIADAATDPLFEAGCDDATFGVSNGLQFAEFNREATDFAEAVASAIRAIETSVRGAVVVEVRREPSLVAPG